MSGKLLVRWDVIDQWLAVQDWKDQRFAEAVGVDQSYISLLRSGKRSPSFETLESFFDVTSLEPNRMLTFARHDKPDSDSKKS